MTRKDITYNQYLKILKEELVPAMGCTEPIAIAYAAATASDILGERPVKAEIYVSGNIIKNVKSVVVPNTDGMRGIQSALAAGIVAGDSSKKLEVISEVSHEQICDMKTFIENTDIEIISIDKGHIFDIGVKLYGKNGDTSFVRIVDMHTNIISLKRNDEDLKIESSDCSQEVETLTDRGVLTIEKIIEFADIVDVEDLRDTIGKQIEYNMAIAEDGIKNPYGANVGKTLLKAYGDDVKIRARAMAAAGSDARMNGCERPVIINSGSGNQGITASVPVIVYAREYGISEEKMYKALAVSNLCTIHLKAGIGTLSAYCGAISAGCSSGAGIAYLLGGGYREVAHTLVNALAIISGVICDGAKASCAGKISAAVDAGILGYNMFLEGNQFYGGDGIVKKGVENTINNVSRLAHDGMAETDKVIIDIMVD